MDDLYEFIQKVGHGELVETITVHCIRAVMPIDEQFSYETAILMADERHKLLRPLVVEVLDKLMEEYLIHRVKESLHG